VNLILRRRFSTTKSTVGQLSVDAQDECWTLEPPVREDKPRAIPPGSYDVSIRYSPKHKRLIPHVENVPGFEEIEIHIGNGPDDTQGCVLVGSAYSLSIPDWISGSKDAFNKLFYLLQHAWDSGERITISIVATLLVFFGLGCAAKRPVHFSPSAVTKIAYEPGSCSFQQDGRVMCTRVYFTLTAIEAK